MNAFQNAANLRGKMNKETLNVAHGAYDLPTSVPMTGEPMTGDNNSLRTLHGDAAPKTFLAAGGLVKKVVAQQRQRMLPKLAEGPQYMAEGGLVDPATGLTKSRNGFPDYGYGDRYQPPGDTNPPRPKAQGFYGEVPRPDGSGFSSEISTDVGHGEIPTMVPGLSKSEMDALLSADTYKPAPHKPPGEIPDSVYQKAGSYAAFRQLNGQAPFAGVNDKRELMPVDNDNIVSNALKAPNDPVYKAAGGPVTAPRPTTMAEDTVDAKLHPDEYVIPAEVVRKKGVDFFDRLVQNAQGERKGIVPTMKNGTVYAYGGGDVLKTIEESTGVARKSNYVPLSAQAAAGQTTPIQEYEKFSQSQAQTPKGPTAAQAQIDKAVGVGSKAGVTPLSAQSAAGQTTPIQEYEKFAQSQTQAPKGPSPAQAQIDKSVGVGAKAGVTPLTARGADAEIVSSARNVPGGLEGTIGRMFSKLPEYEAARSLVAAPKYQQGLDEAAKNIQSKFPGGNSSFAGKALPGQTTAVDRKDFTLQTAGSAAPSSATTPATAAAPTASPSVKTSNLGSIPAPTQTAAPTTAPAYSTTALPDGGQRLELTQPTGEKITPDQIAAIDAADAKRLSGILNFNNDRVANIVRGQGGFDPIEQYKQKLAADAEYQNQRDTAKAIQFRNYGTVFPEERGYGQPDNSPVTKQMEIDAAKQIAEAKPDKVEKVAPNKYKPVVDPVTGAVTGTVPVEGPEADAAYASQRAQAASNKSNLAYNLLNNPDALDQYPEEDRPKLLEAAKQWVSSDSYKNWLKANR